MPIEFTLSFEGSAARANQIDFYDVSQALIGFQRSLALTTHLVINNQIITQAPSLKGARILATPPEEGSWKFTAVLTLIATGTYQILTADKETVLGNLVTSAYDYVISESLGFHVDFNKTLGQQFEELHGNERRKDTQPESRFDSLIEKCETAIGQIHRPLVESQTADAAQLIARFHGTTLPIGKPLTPATYEYLEYSAKSDDTKRFKGKISSYNANTFKGRVYLPEENRLIPFILSELARNSYSISKITESLAVNALTRFKGDSEITFNAYTFTSKTNRLKSLLIVQVI